jgi:uncharacterized membrane protein
MAPSQPRLKAVDALRGLAMIIMALDHVRDFNYALVSIDPEDLTKTTVALFFTRWITHLCAPAFMFTAGVGAYWRSIRHSADLSAYLLKRGLWLMLLDLTVFRFVLNFSMLQGPVLLVVLWALGCSMVVLALLVRLPLPAIAILSGAMILLHNLLDPVRDIGAAWNILHQRGAFALGDVTVFVAYPLIPWIGVMAAGYCFGPLLKSKPPSWILRCGLLLMAGFVVLRLANIYGDPQSWDGTLLSFLRCTKGPPSLLFLLMTLGPAVALLGWFGKTDFSERNPLIVFGRTPLFYFIVHLYLAKLISFAHQGVDLAGVYGIWIGVVVAMYPLCVWFKRVKEQRRSWWLDYL